jgi:hypothetical protein
MFWKPTLQIAAVIAQLLHVRRCGTSRAFIVRGYERVQRERAVAGDIAIERTSERYGIFRRIAPTTPRAGGLCLHIVRDWWLRICGHAAEALRRRHGATYERAGGVGRDAAISSGGYRFDRHRRGVGGEWDRQRKRNFWDGVCHGPVHGSGSDAHSGKRDGDGDQPSKSGRRRSPRC